MNTLIRLGVSEMLPGLHLVGCGSLHDNHASTFLEKSNVLKLFAETTPETFVLP